MSAPHRSAPQHDARGGGRGIDRIDAIPGRPAGGAVGWGEPQPIDEIDRIPLPASAERFPAPLWAFVDAVAESRQVPRDMVFLLVLSILSTSSGGRWRAVIGPDWTETLALMTVVSMPSGSLKSPTVKAVAAPLYELQRELMDAAKPRISEATALRDLRLAEVERLKRKAGRGDVTETALLDAVRAADEVHVPAPPLLLADDVTPETLGVLMGDQGGRMGVISPEGGLFAILAGRYSNGTPNLDLVLKSWSGDPVRVDRLSRDPLVLDEPFLAIGVTVQPDIIEGLAETRMFRGTGLLARFFFALPPTLMGHRNLDPEPVPPGVTAAYGSRVDALARAALDRGDITDLDLTPSAWKAFQAFRAEHEPTLDPAGGALSEIADWGSKLPGQLVRIAALFALFDNPNVTAVGEGPVRGALDLAPYLTGQALAAFDAINGRHARAARPRAVLAWLRRKSVTEFTVRQARRDLGGQNWATSVDTVRDVLEELEDLGWIRLQAAPETERRGPGRARSERYEVNPATHCTSRILSIPSLRPAIPGPPDNAA